MNRRRMILLAGTGMLTACTGGKLPELPVAVSVNLPPEIKAIIDDAQAIVAKVESISGTVPSIGGLVDEAKGIIATLSGGGSIDTKTVVGGLIKTLGTVATFLPPPYGLIASAIETLLPVIGGFVGMRMAARRATGMTPAMARQVLRS